MGLIWVTTHPSLRNPNRVALYEDHPDHPGRAVAIDGADVGPHQVAETPGVLDALTTPAVGQPARLVRLEESSPEVRAILRAREQPSPPAPADDRGTGQSPADPLAFLTPEQRAALAAHGYGTVEAIRAETDDAKLDAVPGIGEATVKRLRDVTKE